MKFKLSFSFLNCINSSAMVLLEMCSVVECCAVTPRHFLNRKTRHSPGPLLAGKTDKQRLKIGPISHKV